MSSSRPSANPAVREAPSIAPRSAGSINELDTRARILQVAGELFADRGYRNTTIRDIATAASVNLASVNYYFGGKQPLYLEAITWARSLRPLPKPASSSDPLTPVEQLRGFIRGLLLRLDVHDDQRWTTRLLARELMSPTDFCTELVAGWYRPIFESLMGIVDGIVQRELELPVRQRLGFSIIGQCLFYRVSGQTVRMFVDAEQWEREFSLEQLTDHILRFSLAALREFAKPGDAAANFS